MRFHLRVFGLVVVVSAGVKSRLVTHIVITTSPKRPAVRRAPFRQRAKAPSLAISPPRKRRWGDVTAINLLHRVVTGFRLEVALNNPVVRHVDQRLLMAFISLPAGPRRCCAPAGRNNADIPVKPRSADNDPPYLAACKGVINHRVGKIGLRFTQSITTIGIWRLFPAWKAGFWILRTHHQQAIHALCAISRTGRRCFSGCSGVAKISV